MLSILGFALLLFCLFGKEVFGYLLTIAIVLVCAAAIVVSLFVFPPLGVGLLFVLFFAWMVTWE
jgi:hypothetical protein